MESNLEKLALLTENLPLIQDQFIKMTDSSSLFKAKFGTILGWKLVNDLGFGVHKWFISKDTEMGVHSHLSIETIIVCKGKMIVTTYDKSDESTVLLPGDSAKIPVGIAHNAACEVDTWVITITIPSAEGFPK